MNFVIDWILFVYQHPDTTRRSGQIPAGAEGEVYSLHHRVANGLEIKPWICKYQIQTFGDNFFSTVSSCSYFHLFPFQECLEYDKSAESTTKSNSTKVSVISKVCSKEGKWQLRFLFIHTYFKIMYLWLSLRLCQALYLFKSFLILLLTPLPHNIESKN